jgi:regulator of sirC expression with transglutaminase-like and TPR domain
MYPETKDLPNLTMSDCNVDFAKAVSPPEDQIDVAYAALLYARDAYPDLDVQVYLERLDDMASQMLPRLADAHPIDVFRTYLFEEQGFRGNIDDYFDPRNSFLNQVIDRRTGVPISLSAIYLVLAQRMDLPFVGIALPGHFIVRYDGDAEPVYLDPYNAGVTMTIEDCRQRIKDISGGRLPFKPEFLDPVGSRQILARLLRNLKAIYVARAEFDAAVRMAEKLMLLIPSAIEEIRDLGVLHYYAGNKLKAIDCLEKYLNLAPEADDLDTVQHNLGVIIKKVARWN